jgi:hypothetical protein
MVVTALLVLAIKVGTPIGFIAFIVWIIRRTADDA